MTTTTSGFPLPTRPFSTRPSAVSRYFAVVVFATMAASSIEGYLRLYVHPQAGKFLPGLLLGSWGLYRLTRLQLPRMPALSLLSLALAAVAIAATGVNATNSFSLEYLTRWAPFLVLVVCLVDLTSREVHPRVALYGMVLGAAAAGGSALFAFVFLGDPRATGPMEDPNDLAYVLVAGLPLALVYLTSTEHPRWVRYLALAAGALCLGGTAATVSRGGALAIACMFVWAIWRKVLTPRTAMLTVLAVLIGGLAFVVTNQAAIETALAQKAQVAGTNVDTRMIRWQSALGQLADNPVLGVGPGGNREHYREYSNRAELAEESPVTHNMYIEVGSELGLLGLAVFVAMIMVAFNAAASVHRDDSRRLALSLEASLLAICVASTFLSEQYYMPLWATMAVMVGLHLRTRESGCASST